MTLRDASVRVIIDRSLYLSSTPSRAVASLSSFFTILSTHFASIRFQFVYS